MPAKSSVTGVKELKPSSAVYRFKNLDCADCAAKIERKIAELPGVESCALTFAIKTLRVTSDDHEALLPRIREVCAAIEPDAEIITEGKHMRGSSNREHKHEHNHSHNHEDESVRKSLFVIIAGALLFVAGEIAEFFIPVAGEYAFIVFIAAYLILGGGILLKAAGNLTRGQIFDENFLMSVATIGAIAIGQYAEAVGVMLFFRVGEFFEHRAVEKSRGQIMSAIDMRPETVNLVNPGGIEIIPAENALAGDVILVRPGDRIPLDGVVTEGESRVDTSPVTGEPVPVRMAPGDRILSGCVNTSGVLKIRVEKILAESMVTRILESVENAAAGKPRIDRFITRFARVYTPLVLALALLTAVVPPLFIGNWGYWTYTALTFLVISCPCALVLSVPLAFFAGIGAGARVGVLFKGGVTLEALSKAKAVVMDKTGTITKGVFEVSGIFPSGDMTGDALLRLAAGCESVSTHPIAAGITVAAKSRGIAAEIPRQAREIAGKGVIAMLDGNEIICGSSRLMEENGIKTPNLPSDGSTRVYIAKNGVFSGYISIDDVVKDEAANAIAEIRLRGLHSAMLTGDSSERAEIVSEALKIDETYAGLLPGDKLSKLATIRAANGSVMFVGDGINDAPVLAAADVGAAMGSGADAAIEVADVVFMSSSLESVPQSISIARETCRAASQNIFFALAVKVAVMALGLFGLASMWAAVLADTGVLFICVMNSVRILRRKSL